MKKISSILLALILLVGILPFSIPTIVRATMLIREHNPGLCVLPQPPR